MRRGEPPATSCLIDDLAHLQRCVRDELLDDAGCDPPHTVGLAAIVTERELVEIGLQVLGADRARVRAEEPALQQRDRPVARLDSVVLAPLCLGLRDCFVGPLVQTRLVVSRVPVGRRSVSAWPCHCSRRGRGARARLLLLRPEPVPCAGRPFPRREPRRSARKGRAAHCRSEPSPRAAYAATTTLSGKSRSRGCAGDPWRRCRCGAC